MKNDVYRTRRLHPNLPDRVAVRATVGDRLVADGEILFVHLNSDDRPLGRIDQKNFVFRMNLMDIMDVGKIGTGMQESSPPTAADLRR